MQLHQHTRPATLLFATTLLLANIPQLHAAGPVLQSYEPNTMGLTKDSDDELFFDFKLSVKYQPIPKYFPNKYIPGRLFFSFSGRFGQYFPKYRPSSPVIGKRFNPKLFLKFPFGDAERKSDDVDNYVDIGYAHESNGQTISTQEDFDKIKKTEKNPNFAKDYISRGWDYAEINVKNTRNKFATILTLNYYLHKGLLQGHAEEYRDWENDREGKRRATVNGLRALFQYNDKFRCLSDVKAALILETGYRDTFQNWSTRGEVTFKPWGLPFMLWASNGYNSDLALYYKRITSYGFAVEIGSF